MLRIVSPSGNRVRVHFARNFVRVRELLGQTRDRVEEVEGVGHFTMAPSGSAALRCPTTARLARPHVTLLERGGDAFALGLTGQPGVLGVVDTFPRRR